MKEWGSELWDRLDLVVQHSRKETGELEGVYSKFLKERGEIEKEYAKNLRKLIANYSPKEAKKEAAAEEETSQTQAFRLVLQETRYQANQHETLADLLAKTLTAKIHKKAKELGEVIKKNVKEAKKLAESKDKSDRSIEKSKDKYQRSFFEWEQAEADYNKAESSMDVSRAQIDKLKKTSGARQRMSEQFRGDYARELIRANEAQRAHYYTHLPTILNNLQNLEVDRTNFCKEVLLEGLRAEKEIMPIIVKCLDEMERCMENIDAEADTQLVIYRYKTGNVPPADAEFEEMTLGGGDKIKTLKKQAKSTPPSEPLFPKKRELERKIEAMEQEIQKGQREIAALRLMYETYSQNPQYGDKKNFQGELEAATLKVQNQESQMHSLTTQLNAVNAKLQQLQNRTPNDTPKSGRRSPSHGSDKGSMGYGTISNSSNSSEQDTDSLGEKTGGGEGQALHPHHPAAWEEEAADLSWPEDDFPDEFEVLPPPPISAADDGPPPNLGLVRALYDFTGEEESTISMVAGQDFYLLEPDAEGWSKVQALNNPSSTSTVVQGFVPTAFVEAIR